MRAMLRGVPPNFLAIPFGLAGLGVVWRTMAESYGAPNMVANVLLVTATVTLIEVVVAQLVRGPRQIVADLRDSALSPFPSLAFIVPIVIAGGIVSVAPSLAKPVFIGALIPVALTGGWMTGQWIAGDLDVAKAHPGYFLPTVAGGFLSAQVAPHVGLRSVGMLCFGVGVACWLQLGSVILTRLLFTTRLPTPLTPTLAIEVAPPAVAGSAYFALHGLRADTVSYALAGYAVLMVLVQVRLLPLYLRLRFTPGFWAFTFSWSAVALLALHWLALTHPSAQRPLAWLVCGAVTALVFAIAVRTVVALTRRDLVTPMPRRALAHANVPRGPAADAAR
jgi:tellurite resistance protein